MDGLSVASSIAGLVALADTIFTRLFRYARAVKRATKDVEELAVEIRSLSSLLHGLNLVVSGLEEDEARKGHSLNLAGFRLHHVSSCLTTLTNIQKKLDKFFPEGEEHELVKQALRSLQWPFSATDIKELLAEVEKHKSNISMALSGDTLSAVLKTLSRQEDLAAGIEHIKFRQEERWAMHDRIRMDKKREEVLAFFGKVDTSSNHKMSLKLRHPLTCLWLTEGLTFQTWLLSRNSKLWLSGIPGAGKTVIAASVIEEAMKNSNQDRAVAYFYCDYKDVEKQNPNNILGSLAKQLARQHENAFSKLEKLHHACHPGNNAFGTAALEPETLASTVCEMASYFDDVSIIVDGLDECGRTRTSEVVKLLVGLASNETSNTRTLFLSRDEPEIRAFLEKDYSHLEIAAHSEDLRLYVAAEMEARQHKVGRERLRIKSSDVKELMMKTLIEKADGMFRWVSCQLDYLCSLPNDAEKRKALGSLPPGLEATYERILERVNQEDESIQRMVQKTLQWIVNANDIIMSDALCHAISINDGDKILDQESLYDEEDILLYCSSLIRRSAEGDVLEMAHFTVKEYLSALPPDHSPYSRYSQAENFVYPQLATTCLSYILLDCFNGSVIEDFETWEDQIIEYPFRRHAVQNWYYYARNHLGNTSTLELAQNLFNPLVTSCFLSWARDLFSFDSETHFDLGEYYFDIFTRHFCGGGIKPLHIAAALGLHEICSWLIASNCDVNERSNVGTPLHCAILGAYWLECSQTDESWSDAIEPFEDGVEPGNMEVLEILIANGADCNALYRDRFGKDFPCSQLAFFSGFGCPGAEHPLVKVVAAGARLEDRLLENLNTVLHGILDKEEFVEALVSKLKETNQDDSIRLHAALKLNSSSGFDIVKSHSTSLASISIDELADLFSSAIRFDQAKIMEELVRDRRLDISCKYRGSGETFLHNATEWKSIGAIRLLLSLGANVNSTDDANWTPLHVTVNGNESERLEPCVSLLLEYGADVNAATEYGDSVWHIAARKFDAAAIRLLLERRGNETQALSNANKDGLTPLFIAAQQGDSQKCELLLSHDSYLPQTCPKGLSLVHYAVKMSSIKILHMLQSKHFELTTKTEDGRNGLHFISSGATTDILHLLIESGVDATLSALNGETPLHVLACLWPMPDAETFDALFDLLATKETINSITTEGLTPLHYALHPPDYLKRFPYNYSLTKHVETLIAKGANVHMRLADGRSCITNLITKYMQFEAEKNRGLEANRGNPRIIRDLQEALKAGRNRMQVLSKLVITATNNLEMLTELIDGNLGTIRVRILNWFVSFGDAELINLLIEKGVDVDLRNTGYPPVGSWSALNCACWYSCSLDSFQRLLKKSTSFHESDGLGGFITHISCMAESNSRPSILEELCKAGLDANLPTDNAHGLTPLMHAARGGKLDHIQILLDYGADVRITDLNGSEAAHWAASSGQTRVIERFMDFDINWNRCLDGSGMNILHIAAICGRVGLVNFILRRSLIKDLDCQTAKQASAISLAASSGHHEIVRILLQAGADVDIQGKDGTRPIHLAACSGNLDVIRVLLNKHCSLVPDDSGKTPQLTALRYGHQEAFDVLKEYGLQKGIKCPLASDISKTDAQELKEKAAIAKSKMSDLQFAIEDGDFALCKALVEAGFNIHAEFSCGCTPVLSALALKDVDIARYLAENGASLRGRVCSELSTKGYSAIHLACTREKNFDILKFALAEDASTVSLAFQSPVSPLHIAVACNNIAAIKLLLQYWKEQYLGNMLEQPDAGIKTNHLSRSEESFPNIRQCDLKRQSAKLLSIYDAQIEESKLAFSWVLSSSADLYTDDFYTGTPLHLAAYLGNIEAAKLLLDYGARIDSIDSKNDTPLLVASASSNFSTAQLLVDRGANLYNRNYYGLTPAIRAVQRGHMGMLKLLCNGHMDLTLTCTYGWTLLHYAARGGPTVFSYLLTRGCCPYAETYTHETPLDLALLRYDKFPTFLSFIFNLDLDFFRWKTPISQREHAWADGETSMLRFFLKRAPSNIVCQELEATTWTNGSVLGDAAKTGGIAIVELLVRAGANLELDRGTHGTPLLTACAFGNFPVVKYLVQAGASILSTKGGWPFSAVEAARYFPNIIQWLLVERHMEQARIDCSCHFKQQPIHPWSGIQCVKVETARLYSQLSNGSSIDHAKKLAKLRRQLQGEVVQVFDGVEIQGAEG